MSLKLMKKELSFMPMPANISYMWNMGSLLGLCLVLQILTGLFLTFHYSNSISMAFDSISHIMRDVNYGWMMRIFHANGASMFFIFIYIHIARGIFYGSFLLKKTWMSGLLILFLLMGTAFIGYVLPWGQMSFWGASVITNLISAFPYIGKMITFWVWGGFSVDAPTLSRFFSLHFLLPFVILVFVISHILFLHETGSNNPLGLNSNFDKLGFYPFFYIKDLYGLFFVLMLFIMISFLNPFIFMDCDNFILANPLVTPPHIQPEWYFLFAYAILRSIPSKLGGVLALFFSILINLALMWKKNKFCNCFNSFFYKILFMWFCFNFLFLTFLGACPVENPFVFISQILSILYFLFYLIYMF